MRSSASPISRSTLPRGDSFFTRDKGFYATFLRLFLVLAMQNIVTYSVNVADNVMLGSYSQTALSGAAAVNQIQYLLQQVTNMGLGEGLIVLASQYWGQRDTDAIRRLSGAALMMAWGIGGALTAAAFIAPDALVGLFVSDPGIIAEGVSYLSIMRYSYLIFMTTSILLCTLRSVQIVGVAFRLSVMTLLINVSINYALIFGHFGFPEMGIRGAAIGTLTARCVEFVVILLYCRRKDLPISFDVRRMFRIDRALVGDYLRVTLPCSASTLLFSSAVAMQTAILGRLSVDAIAANSAAGTLFQYCKMIPISASAAAGVFIGRTVGSGDLKPLRGYVRTLQALFLAIGFAVSALLLCISTPLLSMYTLTPQALQYARQIIFVLAVTSIGTSYEMPCLCGIVRAGGDARYVMINDTIYSWLFTVPLSLCAAFVWRWPVFAVVFCMNVDQLLKCITVTIKTNSYTWIKKLAHSIR